MQRSPGANRAIGVRRIHRESVVGAAAAPFAAVSAEPMLDRSGAAVTLDISLLLPRHRHIGMARSIARARNVQKELCTKGKRTLAARTYVPRMRDIETINADPRLVSRAWRPWSFRIHAPR
jgi:hypothetical protein